MWELMLAPSLPGELPHYLAAIAGAGGLQAIIWGKDKVKERRNGNGSSEKTEARLAAGSEKFEDIERRISAVENEVKDVPRLLGEIQGMEHRMDSVEHEVKEVREVLVEVQKTMVRVETKLDLHMKQEP